MKQTAVQQRVQQKHPKILRSEKPHPQKSQKAEEGLTVTSQPAKSAASQSHFPKRVELMTLLKPPMLAV
jgi:hypothetical protein